MSLKVFYSALAIALTFIAYLPYIRSIHDGRTKPHVFSWIIWGMTTLVVGVAQWVDNGGAGSWPIVISGLLTLYVAVLAFTKRGDFSVSRSDWVYFWLAMSSLPLWYLTADPLIAVIILTVVEIFGFMPSFRKAYLLPHEERLSFFMILAIRNGISLLALEHYSLVTILFPLVSGALCVAFFALVVMRRRELSLPQ
ncbi:hypothetical protein QCD60_25575 [Pokkaliibacter sp. MBI-7]|uniref:hypothetical protein n=1 Tax=Pokkaliibacter sp. MBI-7 TaxID=3040600 RepID=UPI00244D348D|nr:hypothetical protein [Pokkaliibacter sp. MBI-7]MDH2435905.1 hypothetical protein [Pokkaliibacter sp. MBI-7]